ncbi:uncharacterized protein LOC144477104 isoform X2 [Augochlora pura]
MFQEQARVLEGLQIITKEGRETIESSIRRSSFLVILLAFRRTFFKMATAGSSKVNLPNNTDPDFVSHEGEYDYPFYIARKKEWPYYKSGRKGITYVTFPYLIKELSRFVPYLMDGYVRFRILNMSKIRVKKILIVGFVVHVREDARYFKYQVDDGTGSIAVCYDKNRFRKTNDAKKKVDMKYYEQAAKIKSLGLDLKNCPKRFPDTRPKFVYPADTTIQEKATLEHKWWLETEKGMLGKYVRPGDYVIVSGFCNMDFRFHKRPRKKLTAADLSRSKLTIFAMTVTCLTEQDYNEKMYMWIDKVIRKRYDSNSRSGELIPNFTSYLRKR